MGCCEMRTVDSGFRRALCASLALLAWLGLANDAVKADEVTRVFLFAGQSNMVGSDAHAERIDDYPEFRGAGKPQADVLYSYILGNGDEASQGWKPLQPLSAFGPELTFARRVKRQVDGPIAIIKSAVGGTTVAFDWNPDAPEKGQKLYPRTLKLIRDSLYDLEQRGIRYRLEGVMWHQGENDMLDRQLYKQYAAGLTRLIAQLRQDLQAPELKWYLAEVSEKGIWGMDHRSNLGIFREQQQQVLNGDPLLRWVPTSHLAFEVMGSGQPHYHYGTQGQLQLGEAFAEAYLKEIGRAVPQADRRFRGDLPVVKPARVHLFVVAGQRNMEGEDAFVAEIPSVAGFESLTKSQDQVLFRYSLGGGVWTSADWEPLGPVDGLGNFGPELSLGARLRRAVPAHDGVAIVKFTHSGAQSPDWSPQGTPEAHRQLYPKFLAFVREAQKDLERRGLECRLEAVFWHTGENDTFFGPYAQNYAKGLQPLIEQVRLDLQQPGLPWVISEQHPKAPWKNMDAVNAGLRELAKTVPHVTTVDTTPLPHGKNFFGTAGTLALGQSLAEAYLKTASPAPGK
ncbi:MAG: hypothetical protein JSS02_28390 [Planctomycetes bacterium]|nr:hypothetical protein [Planctomycetota bacterium]